MVFIDVQSVKIVVKGDTYGIRSKLGKAGFGFQFNKDKKQWKGDLTLKALEYLADQSGAILTPAAHDELAALHRSAERRAAYMASRKAAGWA